MRTIEEVVEAIRGTMLGGGMIDGKVAIGTIFNAELDEILKIHKAEKPKIGRWEWELEDWNKWTCSECGFTKRTDVHVRLGYNYCPNCGAEMESD